jgi:hypothetical protein
MVAVGSSLPGADDRIEALKYSVSRCDNQIETELGLVSNRIEWLTISQAFLLAAWVESAKLEPRSLANTVQLILLFAGLLIAICVDKGVLAALRVVDKRKNDRKPLVHELAAALRVPVTRVEIDDKEHRDGNLAPIVIPKLMCVVWMWIFCAWLAVRLPVTRL